jgi:hypothetical protein
MVKRIGPAKTIALGLATGSNTGLAGENMAPHDDKNFLYFKR